MPVPAESKDTTKQPGAVSTGGAGAAPAAPGPAPTIPAAAQQHNGDSKSSSASAVHVEQNSAARSNGGPGGVSPPPALQQQEQQPLPAAQQDGATAAGDRPQKIFVGGLSWQTGEDTLRENFEQYGEVTECNIMKDPISKRSRGFGFITFKDPASVEKVLNVHTEQPICIDEKTIDPKIAIPPKRLSAKVKRIFVGGLSSDSSEDDLREYFETFGKVVESQLMYDRNTNRHRGFGFVTFESEEPAEKVCSIQYHDIKGKKVEVKVAQTKEALAMQHGRNKMISNSRSYSSYSNYPPSYTQYYPPSHHYSVDMMGYSTAAGPMLFDGKHRGGKTGGYSQYPAYSFAHSGWGDHRMNGGVYYAPAGYGGIPMPLLRGHMDSAAAAMVPTSGMDYITDHFQGMALGYPPPSPVGSYAPLTPISMSAGIDLASNSGGGGAYSPPHNLSPKGSSSASVNGYNSQVPGYTGGQPSYPVAQASY